VTKEVHLEEPAKEDLPDEKLNMYIFQKRGPKKTAEVISNYFTNL